MTTVTIPAANLILHGVLANNDRRYLSLSPNERIAHVVCQSALDGWENVSYAYNVLFSIKSDTPEAQLPFSEQANGAFAPLEELLQETLNDPALRTRLQFSEHNGPIFSAVSIRRIWNYDYSQVVVADLT